MENNTNNIDLLEELKQDYQLVTKKLESQQINNERLLRTVMKNKMKEIKQYTYVQLLVLLPIIIYLFLKFYFNNNISLPLVLVTFVLCVADIIVDFRIDKVMGKDWLEEDLLASRSTLLKMKQLRTKHILSVVPLLLVWGGFFSYDLYIHQPTAMPVGVLVGAIISGGLVGLGVAYACHRKEQRIIDEIIDEIDRFKNEKIS